MNIKIRNRLLLIPFIMIGISSCSDLNYKMNSYRVHVEVDPFDAGNVSPDRDSTFTGGDQVTLEAVSNEGYAFKEWTGDF